MCLVVNHSFRHSASESVSNMAINLESEFFIADSKMVLLSQD